MKTWRKALVVLPIVALALAGCGGGDETTEPTETEAPTTAAPTETETTAAPTETETEETVVRADADLVIWADETRADVIKPFADQFAEEQGITVAVQQVIYERMRDNVATAAPAGEGPDVFIGGHDWLGQFVADGIAARLDLPNADDFLPAAVQAFNWEGANYGLPYAIENIALFRNTDLVPEPVASLEEMVEIALGLVESGDAEVPLAWQQPDTYHNYWVVTALGGYVFGQNDDGSYDPEDLGIDSEGGLAAAEVFEELATSGALSQDVNYEIMLSSFSSGEAPFAITGPWAVSDFDAGSVNYVVEALPSVQGNEPAPFVGVQGFFVSGFAENELAAKTFVLDFLGSDEAQTALFEAGNRPPALRSAFEAASSDEKIEGFGLAGANGYPMPAIPAMNSVWDAWNQAYTVIFSGTDGTEAFTNAADQIRTLLEQ
jgi:arabinogalactan oligomer / maltooligosaccharide transport system substrate-binding protein